MNPLRLYILHEAMSLTYKIEHDASELHDDLTLLREHLANLIKEARHVPSGTSPATDE